MSPVEREFTEFVAQRTTSLLRVAYALTGDQHAAEDLVQTALAKTFVRWRGIRDDADPYVRRVLYHECVSRWRRRRRGTEVPVAALPEPPSVRDVAEAADLRLVLRSALLNLPPRQRAVLVLRYLEDLTVDETAQVLGLRRGTVASQASRALSKLRESMGAASRSEPSPEVSR